MENSNMAALCRTCLGTLDLPVNLFESTYGNLLDVLQRLLAFQVYVEGKEFNVCCDCQGKLIWVSDFQMVCLRSVEPLQQVKTEYTTNRAYANTSQLPKLDVSLTRCPKIEELLSTPDLHIADRDNDDDRLQATFGDNSDLDNDYQPSDGVRKKLKRKVKVSVSPREKRTRSSIRKAAESVSKKLNRSRFKQYPTSEVLQAIKEVHSCRTTLKHRQCVFCDFVGGNAIVLRSHVQQTHKDMTNWCEHCNLQTANVQTHRDSEQCHRWQCKFCQKYFSKVKYITRHLRCHGHHLGTEDVPLRLQQFPKGDVLKALQETRISKDLKDMQCVTCDYVGKEVGHLKIHMYGKHNAEYEKWCRYCNIVTENMEEHRNAVQCYGDQCKLCGEKFTNIKYLRKHLQQHCREELIHKRGKANTKPKPKPKSSGTSRKTPLSRIKTDASQSSDDNTFTKDSDYDKLNSPNSSDESIDQQISMDIDDIDLGLQDKEQEFGGDSSFGGDESDNQYDPDMTQKEKKEVLRLPDHEEGDPFARKYIYMQYEFGEVLEAIEEINSLLIDIKYRQCILCDFVGARSDVLQIHVRTKHKNLYNWCGICNVQSDDLDQHRDSVRCHISQCKFCKRIYASKKILKKHLLSHCHNYKTALEQSATKTRKISYRQYSKEQVLQAMTKCRSYLTATKCVYCDHKSSASGPLGISGLALHMRSMHIAELPNWCKRCNIKTDDLQRHIDVAKCSDQKCVFCKKIFNTISKLTAHLKLHCVATKKVKQVRNSNSKKSSGASNSGSNHAPVKSYSSTNGKCSICHIVYSNLEGHMAQQHNITNNSIASKHLCAHCGKTFPSFSTLKIHSGKIHNDNKSFNCEFKCNLCTSTFPSERGLKLHERCHKKVDPIICDICGKSCLTRVTHKKHMEAHKYGTGPLQCPKCDKQYYGRRSFKLHMRQHAGTNQFHCVPCGKSFVYKCLLQCHLKMHNDVQPYECTICGKRFKADETRKRHERIHTGDKRYKCSICPFSSVQAKGLTLHMKQHPEDAPQANNPHKCPLCHRAFSTNALLVSHIDYCHRDFVKS